MGGQAIALDIGTSGIRGQLIDLGTGRVLRTCITARNPIPGANVMDHLSFAIERGPGLAHRILTSSVQELIGRLAPESLERVAVCGNPIQLSILEGVEIRDLAYAGKNKLESEHVGNVDRRGHVTSAGAIGLPEHVDLVVPPAVRHEIGADALAMMLKSGFLDDDMCMVTDYGTNAEMALKVGDDIFTGSAAAGPALEGQEISCGMLAAPGAMSDLVRTPQGWRSKVLDEGLDAVDGPMINLRSGFSRAEGRMPDGITGTGVIALVYAAMRDERIRGCRIDGGSIRISRRVSFTDADLEEAGKAIGAIRAGHMTLIEEAGISPGDVRTMYMAGASGTYVDPFKARELGMVVPMCTRMVQVGNTSLELAKDLARDPDAVGPLNELRERLVTRHTMFASSETFRDLYVYEIGLWTGDMPVERYRRVLSEHGLDGYLDDRAEASVERVCERDIRDAGSGVEIIDPGVRMTASWGCSGCMTCVRGCPERALSLEDGIFSIDASRCLGTACERCSENCPEHRFDHSLFDVRRSSHLPEPECPHPSREREPPCLRPELGHVPKQQRHEEDDIRGHQAEEDLRGVAGHHRDRSKRGWHQHVIQTGY